MRQMTDNLPAVINPYDAASVTPPERDAPNLRRFKSQTRDHKPAMVLGNGMSMDELTANGKWIQAEAANIVEVTQ